MTDISYFITLLQMSMLNIPKTRYLVGLPMKHFNLSSCRNKRDEKNANYTRRIFLPNYVAVYSTYYIRKALSFNSSC